MQALLQPPLLRPVVPLRQVRQPPWAVRSATGAARSWWSMPRRVQRLERSPGAAAAKQRCSPRRRGAPYQKCLARLELRDQWRRRGVGERSHNWRATSWQWQRSRRNRRGHCRSRPRSRCRRRRRRCHGLVPRSEQGNHVRVGGVGHHGREQLRRDGRSGSKRDGNSARGGDRRVAFVHFRCFLGRFRRLLG